jgi:hypothetical protein
MSKWFSTLLVSALFGASAMGLRAAEGLPGKPASQDESEKRREEWKKLPAEEREAKMKEWRKTNGVPSREEREKKREQFKNMTPAEREAKRKELTERLEKRIAELRAKQTNATITPQESRELERREQILKRFEQGGSGTPRGERSKPVLTNSPARN